MAKPTKLDQREEEVGSETSGSDARALSPSPTHTDLEHPPSPTRDISEGQQQGQQGEEQQQGQQGQAQGLQEQQETSQDNEGDAHPPTISPTPSLSILASQEQELILKEQEARERIVFEREYDYGAKGFTHGSTSLALFKWGHSPGISANLDRFGHAVSIFW